ncbi:MAG TPA: MBL fold metallo-hydrolase [Vicinamibacterales bacterium]|jgi:metallo-beta-lactamase family protein|nr:MBL fold metallo-hydrolase [Vicinamibacterales bacterium]
MASLTFLGAAGTVTGSKHLLDLGTHRVLVDCGLFQGLKELRQRNWSALPVDPRHIDAVILTHAHLDHCGYLPRLVGAGFRGRVFCTPGTSELCSLVLPDSAHIQEEDAREANRHGYSKHHPALPLYTELDAARALTQLQPVGYDRPVPVVPGLEVEFVNAGHLLGSAYARIRVDGKTYLFGGDLGRYGRPVLPDPSPVADADVLLLESTYGDRLHEADDDGARLAGLINDAAQRGGKLIIPSFAIGRVEEVLYWLRRLEHEKRIPVLPVYVDSPMAAGALQFYSQHLNELDAEMKTEVRRVSTFSTERMTVIASPQESAELAASRSPAIVIAASGMATGGRVLHHLETGLPDPANTVLFVGYQAAGTRGRALSDGARQLKLHGQVVPVLAHVAKIDSMSAHADAGEIMRWLSGFAHPPSMTYLVHGEPPALEALRSTIVEKLGWPVHIAGYLERVALP